LPVRQYRLLEVLCASEQLREAVPIDEVLAQVYRDLPRPQDDPVRALKSLWERVNDHLTAQDIPLSVERHSNALILVPLPGTDQGRPPRRARGRHGPVP
jgi:hypothetical protein